MNSLTGFVRAKGKTIVNGNNQPFLLRGVGLGGWLLPEGYMWRLPDAGDRPRKIEAMVKQLVGSEKSRSFWADYCDRFIAKEDIIKIASEGFNSVRLPINAEHIFNRNSSGSIELSGEHMRFIDRLIDWCAQCGIYVILDMHAAPGGQTGTNIDNSENDRPELFTNSENQDTLVELWRLLAERYSDNAAIAGYDLLNEPLPDWFSQYNSAVMPLYCRIIKAIRTVDARHMIILEGTHWATDWSIFEMLPDSNLMLQFHKYWNNPDIESIGKYLEAREMLNVPIFMGEGGENNACWYAGTFTMLEDRNISWNFWTWKKLETTNSPCSVITPKEWGKIVSFLEEGKAVSEKEAEAVLNEFLNNIRFENCDYHPEVAQSLFRRPPVCIPAVFYGYKGEGISYGTGSLVRQKPDFRVNDRVEIKFAEESVDKINFNHNLGEAWKQDEWLCVVLKEEGDWVAYSVNIVAQGKYTVELCISAPQGKGYLALLADSKMAGVVHCDKAQWQIVQLNAAIDFLPGTHRIVLEAEQPTVQIKWLRINKTE